jgi:hypothetical protein
MADDGDRVNMLHGLMGCAAATALELIDREGQLKADFELRDLGLVISLWLKFGEGKEDYGMDEEMFEWRSVLIAYADKAGIDLVKTGCGGTKELEEKYRHTKLKLDGGKKVKADRWDWAKTVCLLTVLAREGGGGQSSVEWR